MAKFIPMELLRRKGNTTRGITFCHFYQNDQNLSAPFAWITTAPCFPSREISEKFPVILCFRCERIYHYYLLEIFHLIMNVRTNGNWPISNLAIKAEDTPTQILLQSKPVQHHQLLPGKFFQV